MTLMWLFLYIMYMERRKIFYGRCSKEESKQKNSIDTQKMIVEDKYGQCDEYFTDVGKSGALGLDKRLGLAEALESLRKGDELIVAKLDRFLLECLPSVSSRETWRQDYLGK